MKKMIKLCTYGLLAGMMLAGCSKKVTKDDTLSAASVSEAASASGAAIDETDLNLGENVKTGAAENKIILADYKKIEITLEPIEISDDQLDQQIQTMLAEKQSKIEITDEAAAKGDTVNIDYKGLKDGVAFEGGTDEGFDLTLGAGQFIPGFEEGLIGAEVGEERNLDLTFPEQYQSEELAGADVVFEVKVNSITRIITPEFDEAFVRENAKTAKTVEAYKEEIRQDLYNTLYDNQKKSAAYQWVMDHSQFELQDQSMKEEYDLQISQMTQEAAMYGMTLEQLVEAYQMDMNSFEQMLRQQAAKGVMQKLMVDAIVAAEKISITDQDKIELAEKFKYESVKAMEEMAGKEMVESYLLTEKAVTFLAEKAVEK